MFLNIFVNSAAASSLAKGLIGDLIPLFAIVATSVMGIYTVINGNRNFNKNSFNSLVSTNRVEWMQKLKLLVSEYSSKIAYYELRQFPENEGTLYGDVVKTATAIKLHLNFKGKADKEILELIEKTNKNFEKILLLIRALDSEDVFIRMKFQIYCMNNDRELFKEELLDVFKKIRGGPLPKDVDIENEYLNLLRYVDDPVIAEMINQRINSFINKDLLLSSKILKESEKLLIILVQIYLKVEWERVKFEARNKNNEEFDFESKYHEYKNYYSTEIIDICKECKFDFIDIKKLKTNMSN